jgi:transcriptional regulator with XRE-family HTH domain
VTNNISFEDWEAEQLNDPEFREALEELEPAYQVARLRMLKGLTQQQLADLVGTKQSSIARLESGKSQPRLSFLRRIVKALGGRLELRFLSEDEVAVEQAHSDQFVIPITPAYVVNVADKSSEAKYSTETDNREKPT